MMWLCLSTPALAVVNSGHNIIFVLTDDQDVMLDGADHQPKTRALIQEEGVTMQSAFVSTPVCCPSRGSFLTGKHIHNIPMVNNTAAGNCSGIHWNAGAEKRTVGVLMQEQGYFTAYGGKYLNMYGEPISGGTEHVPPGWDRWNGLVGNSRYYNYTLSVDGVAEHHQDDYHEDYLTLLLENRTVAMLRARAAANAAGDSRPFFIVAAVPAAHAPHIPAPQHAFSLVGTSAAPAPRTPNYGAGSQGKHWLVETQGEVWQADLPPKGTGARAAMSDWEHVRRLEALLSVDDLVGSVVATLEATGALEKTFFFYASDHGYHLGQFGLMKDKRFPYDHDVRIPCYVRGPGLPRGALSDAMIANIDFVPTFLAIGSGRGTAASSSQAQPAAAELLPAKAQDVFDGVSFLSALRSARPKGEKQAPHKGARKPEAPSHKRSLLLEYHGEANFQFKSHEEKVKIKQVCGGQFAAGMSCWLEGQEPRNPLPPPLVKPYEVCSCQDSTNNTYACVRTLEVSNGTTVADSLYCRFDDNEGFEEYYDMTGVLSKAPRDLARWQLTNEVSRLGPIELGALRAQLKRLRQCAGPSCHLDIADGGDV